MELDKSPFTPPDFDTWAARVERDLGGKKVEALSARTPEGFELRPLYRPEDIAHLPLPPAPGQLPLIRGNGQGPWQLRQTLALASPQDLRGAIAEELEGGTQGITLRLDRPSRTGTGQAGEDGSAIHTLDDLDQALGDLNPANIHLELDAGANTLGALALLAALAERRDLPYERLRASVGSDPLCVLAAEGQLPGSVDQARDALATGIRFASDKLRGVRPWVISSRPWHDAGADRALDLGLTLATAIDGLRALQERGIEPGLAARFAEFQVSLGRDIFMEIAAIRALRMLWSRVLELCGDAEAAALTRVHATTSWRTLAGRDPWVNMLRGTSAAFAGIAGGADSLGVLPFDTVLGESDRLARRVARNTQLILREESGLGLVADPAGGSYYVESLTHELAERAWNIMQDIEAQGGMAAALLSGKVAERVEASAAAAERELRLRKRPVTGVSNTANPGEELPARPASTPVQAQDGSTRYEGRLDLESEGAGKALVDAFTAGLSLPALARALVTDEPARATPLVARREADAFEKLMDAADRHATKTGTPPQVFMAAYGPLPKHRARAQWISHVFHAGGVRMLAGDPAADAAGLATLFKASGAQAAVIVTDDETLAATLSEALTTLRNAGARWVAVAGRPTVEDGQPAPDASVAVGKDIHALLEECHRALEVEP